MTLRRIARTTAVVAGLAVVILALHWVGRFDLNGPAAWNGNDLRRWAQDPVVVVATAARWLALTLAYYLIAVVAALSIWGESERISRFVPQRWIAPLAAVLGVSVVVGPILFGVVQPDPPSSDPLRLSASSAPLVLDRVTEVASDPASMVTSSPGDAQPVPPDSSSRIDPTIPPSPGSAAVESKWLVESGESMWSIACDSLIEAWGRPVTDAEVAPYWREVIEANRDRLVEPGNPDLILPGQEFLVPEPPADPTDQPQSGRFSLFRLLQERS